MDGMTVDNSAELRAVRRLAASGEPTSVIELWREWARIEDEWTALRLALDPLLADLPSDPRKREEADAARSKIGEINRKQEALMIRSDQLRAQMLAAEIRSFDDVAAVLDVVLELDVTPQRFADDRRLLGHLIRSLKRLAPAIEIGTLQRGVVRGSLDGDEEERSAA